MTAGRGCLRVGVRGPCHNLYQASSRGNGVMGTIWPDLGALNRGVSRRSQTGGPSESIILRPREKFIDMKAQLRRIRYLWKSWRMGPSPPPPPPPSIWRPWSFHPWSPSGAPLLVLEWRPIRPVDLSFSFFFPFFLSFFLFFSFLAASFSFFFFFWRPFSDTGGRGPQSPPPGYAPA